MMDDFYRQVFEASPDGLLLVGRDGHIAQANGRACTLFGYAPGELNGQAIGQREPIVALRHLGHAPLINLL